MPKKILLLTVVFLLTPALASAEARMSLPQPSLAMTDDALYPPDFTHFDYADPDAPKSGLLRLGVTGSFDSLNPFIIRGTLPYGLGSGTMTLVYESLMSRGWDEPFTLYGLLAESVEVAEDRSSIIFNLNKFAHFSDGTPVTADDVLFSFETLREKGRPNHRAYYKKVEFAQKLSPTRVKFSFKRDSTKDGLGIIDREMPLIMGLMPIFPKHDWQDRDFNQTTLRPPVGSGPYMVTLVDVGRSITYEHDPNYWGRELPVMRGLYNFNKIRLDYYRDDNVSLQAFKAQQYDIRLESDPTKWATAYDFPAIAEGRVRLEEIPNHRTAPVYGFVFNTRHTLFADPVLRAALQYSFDFTWVNKTLFHDHFRRVTSYFPNSELAATGLPTGKELEILKTFEAQLPQEVFTTPVTLPTAETEADFRDNLVTAETMLRAAGYTIENNQLKTPKGVPVNFEIMLNDSTTEKVALNWSNALQRLGITATVRTIDTAQYQGRISNFNYDVIANKWFNSLSPGNEQMFYWGSASADQKGSRNYAGVKDPIVDALASSIPNAKTREDLVAASRALDRVLMEGHYILPLYYLGTDDIASWTKLHHPVTMPLYGNTLESWWMK